MSKLLIVAALAVLLGLVAFMSNKVSQPYVKEPPKQLTAKQKILQDAERKRQMAMEQAQAMAQRKRAATAMAAGKNKKGAPHPAAGQMQIEENWWHGRPDGAKGIAVGQKEQARNASASTTPVSRPIPSGPVVPHQQ